MAEEERQTVTIEKDQFRFLKRLPWEKIAIWAVFLTLLYLLRSFFTIIFLTFIISYIAWNLVNYLVKRFKLQDPMGIWRRVITVGVFLVFLALIVGSGWLVIPRIVEQGNLLMLQIRVLIPTSAEQLSCRDRADRVLEGMVDAKELEKLKASGEYVLLRDRIAHELDRVQGATEGTPSNGEMGKETKEEGRKDEKEQPEEAAEEEEEENGKKGKKFAGKDLHYHFQNFMENLMGKEKFEEFQKSPEYSTTYADLAKSVQDLITGNIPVFVDFIRQALTKLVNYTLDFLLSLIFSFMLVFSLPSIAKGVPVLEQSKVGQFYRTIAPSVVAFAMSMGRAFQGQAIIALCNTALTLVGMEILGIPNAAVLSVIVFVCSFIPVLGVFISSVPICLVAIQVGGIMLALEAAVLITIIHMVEAYLLNPRILGEVMKMHPLLVLVLLFVFEHFLGVWGLLLAIPAFHYVFYQVILGQKPSWLKTREALEPPPAQGSPPAPPDDGGLAPGSGVAETPMAPGGE